MSELLYPNASLVLDTRHIQLADGGAFNLNINDVDNSKGTFANNGQTITFKNVDIKQVLGNLYDEYTQFNIRLTSYAFTTGGTGQAVVDFGGGAWYISFSRCQLPNQTYNHLLGTATNEAVFFSGTMANATANSSSQVATMGQNLLAFSPAGNRYSDIILDWRNLRSATGKTATTLGHFVFICDIFPILSSKRN